MKLSPEIIWGLIGVFFVFIEIFVPGFVLIFFGLGALLVALTTYLNLTTTLPLQILLFTVSSLLFLFFFRKYFKQIAFGNIQQSAEDGNLANIEIGKIVTVIEKIDPNKGEGKIKYQGTLWKATANEVIEQGESVKIISYKNLTLFVEKVK